jgi:hypothetical protein
VTDDYDPMDFGVDEGRLKEELRKASKRYHRQWGVQDTIGGVAALAIASCHTGSSLAALK